MAPEMIRRGLAALLAMPILLTAQGLMAEWEVRDLALELGSQMEGLGPALDRFDTANWADLSQAYGEQRTAAATEAMYAAAAARQLASKPTGLAKGFELHLRMQTIEGLVTSLAAGARTYQSNGAADDALNLLASASAPRLKLRDYIMELAASKEQELAAIDGEAQRCRAELLRVPAAAPKAAKPVSTNTKLITKGTPKKSSK
jgi:hypothetical protein